MRQEVADGLIAEVAGRGWASKWGRLPCAEPLLSLVSNHSLHLRYATARYLLSDGGGQLIDNQTIAVGARQRGLVASKGVIEDPRDLQPARHKAQTKGVILARPPV